MKLFRQESFGGLLFDTETLRYTLHTSDPVPAADTYMALRATSQRRDILSAPVRVYFEITRRCNLRCSHCFVSSSPTAPLGMTTDTALSVLDHMRAMNVIELRITGGEPTARPDWFQLLSRAKHLGFVLSVNTNGVYTDRETIPRLASLDLEQITISIDGTEATHDAIRGAGSYRASMASLAQLHRAGARLRVNTVLTADNVHQVPQIIAASAPFVKEINFFYMRTVGRAVRLADQVLTFDEHYASSQDTIALRSRYPALHIMHFEQSFTERSIRRDDGLPVGLATALPYGSTTLALHSDGSVWPHGYTPFQGWPELRLGVFPHDRLDDIWHGSAVLDGVRRWLRAVTDRCHACSEHRVRCAGLNFEMELAKEAGQIAANPYCVNATAVPALGDYVAVKPGRQIRREAE